MASLGPVSSLAPGAGKMTFVAACAYAEKRGFSTLVRHEVNTTLDALDVLEQEASLGGSSRDVCFCGVNWRTATPGAILTVVLFSVSLARRLPRTFCGLVPLASRQVLMQIASNSRSFSLYAKLGFEVQGGALASLLERYSGRVCLSCVLPSDHNFVS